jgi:predicted metal-dependent peptidase
MATDGTHLYFHPDFINTIRLEELEGVIAHEVIHCVCNHISRAQKREPKRWNVATDFVTNDLVLKDGLVLPKGCLIDPQYQGMYAEAIYGVLPVSKQNLPTLDSHGKWEIVKQNGKGQPGGQAIDPQQLEQQWRELVAQASNVARSRGKFPAHMKEVIGDLLQPKLDWRSMLQDVVTSCAKSDFRLMPPNKKHLWRGFYLPSITGESINIAFIIDDSGSIGTEEIRDGLTEVKGICEAYDDYTLHLFTADTVVHDRWELHPFDPMPTVVTGRGGTDFRPALKEADQLDGITAIVYFTDLDGTFPSKAPNTPVIWLAVTDKKPPFGFTIKYPRNGERR